MARPRMKPQSAEVSKPADSGGRAAEQGTPATPPEEELPLYELAEKGTDEEIAARLEHEMQQLIDRAGPPVSEYCLLGLFDTERRIDDLAADRIFSALSAHNPERDKDILLLLVSNGGAIEPAFKIAKMCRHFAGGKFVVAIPGQAKSAATLIALGADEIHMGLLGELGPVDPQLYGLPVLGVTQALKTISALVSQYPQSAEMFARYLQQTVRVEQIGYSERICESAVQYAERLLRTKPMLADQAGEAARRLVYEYKDHNFVIDRAEAQTVLGDWWIVSDSPELRFAERAHRVLKTMSLFLYLRDKCVRLIGSLAGDVWIWPVPRR